jgi:hypothetical protein
MKMATRADLVPWIVDGLIANGGRIHFVEIAKHIWTNHRREIEGSGDFFFKWQYEMRWAGNQLVRAKKIKKLGHSGIWELLK